MAYLTINGIDVPVAEGPRVDPDDVGTRAPAVDGQPRESIIARKRTWNVQTGMITVAAATALRAALLSGATVAVTGDWLGAVTAWPVITGEKLGKTAVQTIVLSFTLREA